MKSALDAKNGHHDDSDDVHWGDDGDNGTFVMVRCQFDQRVRLPGLNMKSPPHRFQDDLIDDKVGVAEDCDALGDGYNMIIVIF